MKGLSNGAHKPGTRGIRPKTTRFAHFIALAALLSTACSNVRTPNGLLSGSGTGGGVDLFNSGLVLAISSVTVGVDITGSSTTPTPAASPAPVTGSTNQTPITILFNTLNQPASLVNLCTGNAGAATGATGTPGPCVCQFSWSEINNTGPTPITIPHQTKTPVTGVQASAVSCSAPDLFGTGIATGTSLLISVAPGIGNSNQFSVPGYVYTVGQSSNNGGTFQTQQNQLLSNILRYTCYDQRQRGMALISRKATYTDPNNSTNRRTYPVADRFCLINAQGQVKQGQFSANSSNVSLADCSTLLPAPDFTAQSNYFNMYVRDSEVGDINPGNANYVCPTVQEALNRNGASAGTQGKYWPLDSSFQLSLGQTTVFTVGVEAHTTTSNPGDPTSVDTTCSGGIATGPGTSSGGGSTLPGGQSKAGTLVTSCLGFAATPNADATCPLVPNGQGGMVQTYRLRRYYTLYPPTFDTDGSVIPAPQPIDTIYIVDRPVNAGDPTKNYAMYGPKPCPYSYFDKNGLLTPRTPGYFSTNDARWTGLNVDGIKFPDADNFNSCSAVLPVVNNNLTVVTTTTVNAANPNADFKVRYVRPITAWAPHYEEDKSFKACAPLANPLRDPPLHFAKTADGQNNVSWCAEVYPTQNDNVAKIDPHANPNDASTPYTGSVRPFTSHIVKNSTSPPCRLGGGTTLPAIPGNYPVGGLAHHLPGDIVDAGVPASQTCDRTVVNPVNGVTWPRFPLLAKPSDVEATLSTDPTFACLISFDDGTKAGKASPSQGCCGANVSLRTGAAGPAAAHLEPTVAPNPTGCLEPLY